MNHPPAPPQNPVGRFEPPGAFEAAQRDWLLQVLEDAPGQLKTATAGLNESQLDTKYKNWTIRQIVHHLADSHLQCYVRTKLAVTEEHPTIKPYDEGSWSQLIDAAQGPVEPSLLLLEGLHARWVQFLRSLDEPQWSRSFFHPEQGADVSLWQALNYYGWHARHHTAQILWLREQHGW